MKHLAVVLLKTIFYKKICFQNNNKKNFIENQLDKFHQLFKKRNKVF